MRNLFVLAMKSQKGDKKNKSYTIILVALVIVLSLSLSIINCNQAFDKSFFSTEFSREVRMLGYYENTRLPFYYSEDFIAELHEMDEVDGYFLNYGIREYATAGTNNQQIVFSSVESTKGVFSDKEIECGRDIFANDNSSVLISQSMEKLLFGVDGGSSVGKVLDTNIQGVSYPLNVLGVFPDEYIKSDINVGSGLSELHMVVSGDIGRQIYDKNFEDNKIWAQFIVSATDSKFVPNLIKSIKSMYNNLYIISEYEQIAEFSEFFSVINMVLAVIIIVLILSTFLNVCDIFSLLIKDNRKRTAIMLSAGYLKEDVAKVYLYNFIICFARATVIGLIVGLIISAAVSFGIISMLSPTLSKLAFFPNIALLLGCIAVLFLLLIAAVYIIFKINYNAEVIQALREE